MGARASPVPPDHVCRSTTAPSPTTPTWCIASRAMPSPVRHGSQSWSSTFQCTLRYPISCRPSTICSLVVPSAERTSEPRAGICAGVLDDRPIAVRNVGPQAVPRQQRHAGVVEAVVADQMAVVGDTSGGRGSALSPTTLHEERRPDPLTGEDVQDAFRIARRTPRSIGMFGVERQADPEQVGFIHGS